MNIEVNDLVYVESLNEGSGNLMIFQAYTENHLNEIKTLFEEYAKLLEERKDLGYRGVYPEISKLPGDYAPPKGRLLMGVFGNQLAGCAALRSLSPDVGEIRRVYARPRFRGKGIGRALILNLIEQAKEIGYTTLRLDTTPQLVEAIKLYESLGFNRIPPYCDGEDPNAIFMEKKL